VLLVWLLKVCIVRFVCDFVDECVVYQLASTKVPILRMGGIGTKKKRVLWSQTRIEREDEREKKGTAVPPRGYNLLCV
jgi:hypothetical protein